MILSPRLMIDVDDLPENLHGRKRALPTDDSSPRSRRWSVATSSTGGNLTAAAKRLGVNRGTLNRKMKEWDGGGGAPRIEMSTVLDRP